MIRTSLARLLLLAGLVALAPAARADSLVVGKTTPQGFVWLPVDVAAKQGFFARDGLDVQIIAANGGAKLHQAMVAGAIDVGLGSGTDMGFLLKGAPETAIADLADRLLDIGVIVGTAPIKTLDDLKGARIGVSAPASLTWWVVLQINRKQGWAQGGAAPLAVGGNWPAFTAALATDQVKAVVADPALGFQLADAGRGRLFMPAADIVGDFTAHVIFATNAALAAKPDAVRKFLAGWFEAVRWMGANRGPTEAIAADITGLSPANAGKAYELMMPMFRTDGHFIPQDMAGVARSLVELGLAEGPPDLMAHTTEAYLPK